MIAQGRGLAFIAVDLWPFHPMYRIVAGDRVILQQVIKQAGQRREFAPNGGPGQAPGFQLRTPG